MAEPNPKLWIGNLHHKVSKEDLNLQFCGYGTIQDIKVLDKGPHVYAFVEYSKTEEAEKAFKALQGTEIKGQAMKIEYAQGRKRYLKIISLKIKIDKVETDTVENEIPTEEDDHDHDPMRDTTGMIDTRRNLKATEDAPPAQNPQSIGIDRNPLSHPQAPSIYLIPE